MTPVRLAMIGIDYPHARYRDTVRAIPGEVEIVAFYDPSPAKSRDLLHPSQRDIPIYDDLAALISEQHPEAAMVFLPNNVRPGVPSRLPMRHPSLRREARRGFRRCPRRHRRHHRPQRRGLLSRLPVAAAPPRPHHQGNRGQGPPGRPDADRVPLRHQQRQALRDPQHYLFSKEQSGGGFLNWLACHWLDLSLHHLPRGHQCDGLHRKP
ncbi:MAG: Gfo/Idh/MocA family oxidoreductase [Thermomicrobiales bacterium]